MRVTTMLLAGLALVALTATTVEARKSKDPKACEGAWCKFRSCARSTAGFGPLPDLCIARWLHMEMMLHFCFLCALPELHVATLERYQTRRPPRVRSVQEGREYSP